MSHCDSQSSLGLRTRSGERNGRVSAGSGASSETQHHSFLSPVETLRYRAGLLEVLERFPRTMWALSGLRASISSLEFQCTVSSLPQLACLEGSRAKVVLLDACPFTKILLTLGSGKPSGVEQSGVPNKGKIQRPGNWVRKCIMLIIRQLIPWPIKCSPVCYL